MASSILINLQGEWRPRAQALLLPPIRVTLCQGVPESAPILEVLQETLRVLVTDTDMTGDGSTEQILPVQVATGGDTGCWH